MPQGSRAELEYEDLWSPRQQRIREGAGMVDLEIPVRRGGAGG